MSALGRGYVSNVSDDYLRLLGRRVGQREQAQQGLGMLLSIGGGHDYRPDDAARIRSEVAQLDAQRQAALQRLMDRQAQAEARRFQAGQHEATISGENERARLSRESQAATAAASQQAQDERARLGREATVEAKAAEVKAKAESPEGRLADLDARLKYTETLAGGMKPKPFLRQPALRPESRAARDKTETAEERAARTEYYRAAGLGLRKDTGQRAETRETRDKEKHETKEEKAAREAAEAAAENAIIHYRAMEKAYAQAAADFARDTEFSSKWRNAAPEMRRAEIHRRYTEGHPTWPVPSATPPPPGYTPEPRAAPPPDTETPNAPGGSGGPGGGGPFRPPQPIAQESHSPFRVEARDKPLAFAEVAQREWPKWPFAATSEVGQFGAPQPAEPAFAQAEGGPRRNMTDVTIGVIKRLPPEEQAAAIEELRVTPHRALMRGIDVEAVLAAFAGAA